MEDDFISIKESLNDTFIRLKELENSKNGMTGISTGFCDLDYAIKGLNNSNLIVIGSRPAMGKTALALNIATHVATKENIPVAIFSLDMSREQCTKRILSSQALVENNKLNTGKLNEEEWEKVIKTSEQLSNAEIYIDDTVGISINKIREKCIKLKQEKNIGLILIDSLQLISSNKKCNTREEDSEVSSALKELAQELNIPIIVTYQLSRALEEREDKRPILSDIKDDIIKNSDVVMFLHRDDYYNPYSEKKNIAELIIAKNSYGTSNNSIVELIFLDKWLKFDSLEKR